jgi:ATP-dependent DNA helicase RecG
LEKSSGNLTTQLNSFLEESILRCRGVGEKRAQALAQKGIKSIRDLLFYFPRQYLDRTHISKIGDVQAGKGTFHVKVYSLQEIRLRNRETMLKVVLTDGTGYLVANFFNNLQVRYFSKILVVGTVLYVSGTVRYQQRYSELQITNFEMELVHPDEDGDELIHAKRIVPVYSESELLSTRFLRKLIWQELSKWLGKVEEFMPASILKRTGLPSFGESLMEMHFPSSLEKADLARRRLAFDRLFFMEIYMLYKGRQARLVRESVQYNSLALHDKLLASLPFPLTAAQKRVVEEIRQDLQSPKVMNRLLQGDVGSGKTIVALLTMMIVVGSGYQVALLAPTEILVAQHQRTLNGILACLGMQVEVLVGGMSKREREETLQRLENGKISILLGTHALLQPEVRFKSLGLVIIDEQHKFGVEQRKNLVSKGLAGRADLLVMSATPIPRTLSLTLYGDLQMSVIDELPPGRKQVITRWFTEKQVEKLYGFIREKVEKGEKAYFIYPLVSESDKVDLKDAITMFEHFSGKVFKGIGVGLIHGQMPQEEKEKSMVAFRQGEIRILVSTTVVEVGMDIPDASIIVIEHADRFGLAQLHQLRGRIGRGTRQSFCILVTPARISPEAKQRMTILRKCVDGFRLAEEDLRMRGPGEFLGTKQSGLPDLAPADLVKDFALLAESRKLAEELLDKKIEMTEKERHSLYEAYKQEIQAKYAYIHAG